MRKFLTKIVLFCFIGYVILWPIDILYTKILKTQHIRDIDRWEMILNDRVDANVFILGSSRAMCHYKPLIIDSITHLNSYNFGQDGKTIESDVLLYSVLKNHITSPPKYLIWDIFFSCFGYAHNFGDYQYTPFIFNRDIWNNVNKYRTHFSPQERYFPLLKYFKKKVFPPFKSENNADKGYYNDYRYWLPNQMNELKKSPIHFSIESEIERIFIQTIRELKNNGTEVILIVSPLFHEGLECVHGEEIIFDRIKTIAIEEDCPYYNYLDDPICYDTTYFGNAMHLNDRGATLFSHKIAHLLDSINKAAVK